MSEETDLGLDQQERYWQNWDSGHAAADIDRYWVADEEAWRKMLTCYLRSELPRESRVLEIGCGSGLIFQCLQEAGIVTPANYVGGDVSNSMLAIASERYPNTTFRHLDIFDIKLPDASHPNVISVHVIQHLPEYETALKELMRVAGEKLIVVTWFQEDPTDRIEFSQPSAKWDGQRFYNNFYSLSKFVEYARTCTKRPIHDVRVHRFAGPNYAVCIDFVPRVAKVRWRSPLGLFRSLVKGFTQSSL